MSDTSVPQYSTFRRLLRTPISDLLRLRLVPAAGPVDAASLLAASNLPAPAKDLISRVTRRTRLWRRERADVAAELISHFADGLDAGASIDDLLSRFGDERRAARLIRRAKRRNRPLWWHAWRLLYHVCLAFWIFYGLLAIYYYAGRPTPSVDYVAILNQPTLATPADQRAWPLYRQAILDLALPSTKPGTPINEFDRMLNARPSKPTWPTLVSWLDQHRAALDTLHRAADRPHLGFVLGPGGSAYDPVVFRSPQSDGTTMYDVAMPALTPLRELAEVVAADAAVARESDDRARFLRDVRSLLALVDHTHEHPSLVAQLVSIGIRAMTYEQLEQALASPHVSMLTDDDLRDLAHRLAGPRVASDLVDLRVERMFFHDTIQRTFTAGGSGGGRLTHEGLNLVDRMIGMGGTRPPEPYALRTAVQPASVLLVAPRDEILDRYDRLLDQAESLLHEPLRRADWDAWDRRQQSLRGSLMTSLRNYPISIFLPSLSRLPVTAERVLGQRDGLLCAIALETYRRHHDNAYPASLAALTPGLLPTIPADRVAGDPLRYLLKDGRPVVYSVGDDRTDDHGTPPAKGNYYAALWASKAPARGDWVLYPEPKEPSQDQD